MVRDWWSVKSELKTEREKKPRQAEPRRHCPHVVDIVQTKIALLNYCRKTHRVNRISPVSDFYSLGGYLCYQVVKFYRRKKTGAHFFRS